MDQSVPDGCCHVLLKGKRQGKLCGHKKVLGNTYCRAHAKKYYETMKIKAKEQISTTGVSASQLQSPIVSESKVSESKEFAANFLRLLQCNAVLVRPIVESVIGKEIAELKCPLSY